jgi:hypothetical protein
LRLTRRRQLDRWRDDLCDRNGWNHSSQPQPRN